MRGHGSFSDSVTIYFRADIAPLLRGRNLSVIYVNNPTLRGFFRVEKPFDRGFLAVNALGDQDHPIKWPHARKPSSVERSTGDARPACLARSTR